MEVITLEARDASLITRYLITGDDASYFDHNLTTNRVTFKVAADYESKASYTFVASARDSFSHTTTQNITVTILDVDESVSITYRGIGYKTIISPFTKREWLDRNLGATRPCTAQNDADCFGGYYQWGRGVDGHQRLDSETTEVRNTEPLNLDSNKFITNGVTTDWTVADINGSLRQEYWRKVDGGSICPPEFRVPTIKELFDETRDASTAVVNTQDAFESFLKLPSSGYRFLKDGTHVNNGDAHLWSSSIAKENDKESVGLRYASTQIAYGFQMRSTGKPVRCIKEGVTIGSLDFISDPKITINENTLAVITLKNRDQSLIRRYFVTGGDVSFFDIDETTGVITLKIAADYESNKKSYTFTANASDYFGHTVQQDITVTIADVDETAPITYRGLGYKVVTSPFTQREWLDRNLGATRSCTAQNDTDCFGGYYQWGRGVDGHQRLNSDITGVRNTEPLSLDSNKFIIGDVLSDWTTADVNGGLRKESWRKTDGSSICPSGFRVPTIKELYDETKDATTAVTNTQDAFESFLRMPSSGYRYVLDGSHKDNGETQLWSSDSKGDNKSLGLRYTSTVIAYGFEVRGTGKPVRCIKEVIDNEAPIFTSSSTISVDENNTTAITLVTTDKTEVIYSISGVDADSFIVDELTGVVTFVRSPDYERQTSYTFMATATDRFGQTSEQTITITILDIVKEYSTVISPYTGREWMDRNLGAARVCTSLDDRECVGNYYQWGRSTDGHEQYDSPITETREINIVDTTNNFVIVTLGRADWTTADNSGELRKANWRNSVDNAVCPEGFNVPNINEIEVETLAGNISTSRDAFDSFLKLAVSGSRGEKIYYGTSSSLWSRSLGTGGGVFSHFKVLDNTSSPAVQGNRYTGLPVRCIKYEEDTSPPVFSSSNTIDVEENNRTAMTLEASDANEVTYSISGTDASALRINKNTGEVIFNQIPDYESGTTVYQFTATATDEYNNVSQQDVTINILDLVDEIVFEFVSDFGVDVYENKLKVTTVEATSSYGVSYSISGGDASLFNIDATTGDLEFKIPVDYESLSVVVFHLTVTAIDDYGKEISDDMSVRMIDVDENLDILHNGIWYKTVTSPHTDKVWLDRNLGAIQGCDYASNRYCYGDYYQWGRGSDGHQDRASSTTDVVNTSLSNTDGLFVLARRDWTDADDNGIMRKTMWDRTDGTGICPLAYRVPSIDELNDETINIDTPLTNSTDAFNSFLKMPPAGLRNNRGRVLQGVDYASLASSTIDSSTDRAKVLEYTPTRVGGSSEYFSIGIIVRCIKN